MLNNYNSSLRFKERKNMLFRPVIVVILVAAAIILVMAALEFTNTTHIFHRSKATTSTIPAKAITDNEVGNNNTPESSTGEQAGTSKTGDKSITAPSSGADLLAPSGNFVSNHHPSLKETSNSSGEESVCITTPGAECTITFKQGDVTKTLESKKVDNSGTVIWQWDVEDAGFVAGTWQVTATATLNGQTKSTTDLQNLEVLP